MLSLDGSSGGGQLLRSALSLSLCTGQAFSMRGIRAGRPRPGLLRQHLVAVQAAAAICGGSVQGAQLGALELVFVPGPVVGGDYRFAIGSAGSTTLVLQTLIPALLQASQPSRVRLQGGTHNPMAPSADFLSRCFLPLLRRMGATTALSLKQYGFYPAGGGELELSISPCRLQPITLLERGAMQPVVAEALVASIAGDVAQRELAVVARRLQLSAAQLQQRSLRAGVGPGNVLMITLPSEHLTEVITEYGARGVTAEAVAERACRAALHYLKHNVVVGEHLADQLLLPMALTGGGSYRTGALSAHWQSNAALIQQFLPVAISAHAAEPSAPHPTVTVQVST